MTQNVAVVGAVWWLCELTDGDRVLGIWVVSNWQNIFSGDFDSGCSHNAIMRHCSIRPCAAGRWQVAGDKWRSRLGDMLKKSCELSTVRYDACVFMCAFVCDVWNFGKFCEGVFETRLGLCRVNQSLLYPTLVAIDLRIFLEQYIFISNIVLNYERPKNRRKT